jgi:hypothetical protein
MDPDELVEPETYEEAIISPQSIRIFKKLFIKECCKKSQLCIKTSKKFAIISVPQVTQLSKN